MTEPLYILGAAPSWVVTLVIAVAAVVVGAAVYAIATRLLGAATLQQSEAEAKRIAGAAQQEAENIKKAAQVAAREEIIRQREEFDEQTNKRREELREVERRLSKREDNVERKLDTLATKERALEAQDRRVKEREREAEQKEAQLEGVLEEQRSNLLRITGLSADEARSMLMSRLQEEMAEETSAYIEKSMQQMKETLAERTRHVIVGAIQRYAAEHTCETTVSTVDIPSDDMKGRVIGREGRNIRAFEKATGVDVIVDDTPGVVVVSAFDPVRREIARQSLEVLIQDGRIHPARIEEVVDETRKRIENEALERGKRVSAEVGVPNLHPKLAALLGRLSYRTSYGQNVLNHSYEVAYLCQAMAEEIGLNGALARRCGLLHDIGKAVDHDQEGGHPQIGMEIARRYREPPEVVNAVGGHHGDIEATSLYTPLVAAADAISASRPGARRETLERYIKRLEQLEELAHSFKGVRQAYAIQAGREVRVIVDAAEVDDAVAAKVAREIAQRIEQEMTYPGEVRVTLVRELRCVEYAR